MCAARALELERVAKAPKALDGEGAEGSAFIGVRHGARRGYPVAIYAGETKRRLDLDGGLNSRE